MSIGVALKEMPLLGLSLRGEVGGRWFFKVSNAHF